MRAEGAAPPNQGRGCGPETRELAARLEPRVAPGYVDVREGAQRHREAEAEDDERADRGEEADRTPPLEVEAAEGALRGDREQADRRHRRRQPEAEGDDQDEPVAHAVQRDRREQDDERGRARDDPARDADAEQAAHAERVVVRGVVSVVVAVVVAVVVRVLRAPASGATRRRASAARDTPTPTISSAETRLSHG